MRGNSLSGLAPLPGRKLRLYWQGAGMNPIEPASARLLLLTQVTGYSLPLTACGLRLDDEALRIAACLRLGARTCEPHICPCGGLVTADGSHGLSCGLGPGRYARHAYLNDIISRSLTLTGVPNIKEPRAFREP